MKYCSKYRCGRLLPGDFSGDTCPHCGNKDYDWLSSKYIKNLPPEAFEVKMKCKKCESTEELCYSEKITFGSRDQYHCGNEYECKTCKEAWYAEMDRQEAMNYILINPSEDEIEFYDKKGDVEKFFENYFEDYWPEGNSNPFEDWVILKVEKMDDLPKAEDFQNRNTLYYDYEWYKVEEIIKPEYEFNGDHSVSW